MANGAGTCSGASWSNAAGKIPATLNPGDIVYIGGSTGNLADASNSPCVGERTHTFATSGSSGSHVKIIKCTGSIAACSGAPGWQTSFGTATAQWVDNTAASATLLNQFWSFCPGSYYDVDGSTGTSDQTGTYGFYMQAPGRMFAFIKVDTDDCSDQNITDLTFKRIEINGVEANSTGNGAHGGGTAFYFGSPVSTTATVQNISFTSLYVHDISVHFQGAGNVTNLTIANNWVYTNFSDVAQHSAGLAVGSPGNDETLTGVANFTAFGNTFRNIQGTDVFGCTNGQCTNWKIYNNIIYYTSNWDSICEHGDTTASCAMSGFVRDNTPNGGVIVGATIYGNTLANIHIKPGHSGGDSAGVFGSTGAVGQGNSSGIIVQNNLWWNSSDGQTFDDTGGTPIVSHDYNRWLNTDTRNMTLASHDFKTVSGAIDPFVNSAAYNFLLSSETVDPHLNDGLFLSSPYNVDFSGVTRGADGTWERGAYEFVLATIVPAPALGMFGLP